MYADGGVIEMGVCWLWDFSPFFVVYQYGMGLSIVGAPIRYEVKVNPVMYDIP